MWYPCRADIDAENYQQITHNLNTSLESLRNQLIHTQYLAFSVYIQIYQMIFFVQKN